MHSGVCPLKLHDVDHGSQNLIGTAESAKIHARALDVMVSGRGGLQNLGADGMPRRIVSWSVFSK